MAQPLNLQSILSSHHKWHQTGGEEGQYANLSYTDLRYANLNYTDLRDADLNYANLSYTNLSYADLSGADLNYANLSYADLSYANLRYANLRYAHLRGVDLTGARLPTGETWETYLSEVVPAYLTAVGAHSLDEVPALFRPRAEQFIQLFDAGLIPPPRPRRTAGAG